MCHANFLDRIISTFAFNTHTQSCTIATEIGETLIVHEAIVQTFADKNVAVASRVVCWWHYKYLTARQRVGS